MCCVHKNLPPKLQYNILCLVGFISKHKLWEEDEPSGLLRLRIRNLNESWGSFSFCHLLIHHMVVSRIPNFKSRIFRPVRSCFVTKIWIVLIEISYQWEKFWNPQWKIWKTLRKSILEWLTSKICKLAIFHSLYLFQEIKHQKNLSLAFLDVLQRNDYLTKPFMFLHIYQNLRFFFLSTQWCCCTFKPDD